ncbi:MAG: glutamate--cysteine ligase [Chlamydiales bacterium]|nr:glutamate--cysteine ligase [Chlamydiales bacterium]
MTLSYSALLKKLSKETVYKSLKESKHGLEKESLRCTAKANIAQSIHPKTLGHKLTHPYISTDFAEAQLELITPPCNSEPQALNFLKDVQAFLNRSIGSELLWPNSMPMHFASMKDVKIADFGQSDDGCQKTLYREGLVHRFGKEIQTISGGHYNLSFSDAFFKNLQCFSSVKQQKLNFEDFRSLKYFALIRNFLRYSFINTYLFGASPIMDKSFVKRKNKELIDFDDSSYYMPHACSFRMSNYGYYSRLQLQYSLSFNGLKPYLNDLDYTLYTSHPRYEKIGLYKATGEKKQINTHILQIANEHYSRIRPKAIISSGQNPYQALMKNGVEYVEARIIDLDPFETVGISEDQLRFLYLFMLYCLLSPSPLMTKKEERLIPRVQNRVALKGRDPNLRVEVLLKSYHFQDFANQFLLDLKPLAELLDKAHKTKAYTQSLERQIAKVADSSLTPSAKLLKELQGPKHNFHSLHLKLAKKHKKDDSSRKIKNSIYKELESLSISSLKKNRRLEVHDDLFLRGFEDQELSTQLIIKEALKRQIEVKILDRQEAFLLLKKGKKEEIIKQATKTSLDSYISYLIMENKEVSKFLLKKHGIKVPTGRCFHDSEEAYKSYFLFEKKAVVVKPTTTNFGIGITIIPPNKAALYKKALKLAFSHAQSVIVEDFIEGKEYRFLTVDYKITAICNRDPANVVGDGKKSIEALVKEKNEDPESYKPPQYFIKITAEEKRILAKQKLTPKSVLKKGQKVYLRENSNICTGGDPVDYTNSMHEGYKKIACRAAKKAEAKLCGVDMMVKNPKLPPTKDNYAIIEINFNPALYMHAFPYKGNKVNVGKAVLDCLGF